MAVIYNTYLRLRCGFTLPGFSVVEPAARSGRGVNLVPVPVTSGRTWARDPETNFVVSEEGITTKVLVRDAADPDYTAIAKWGNSEVAGYSLAVERVAYVLGDHLGLPVPEVYLEAYSGEDCAVVRRIWNHREYLHAKNIAYFWSCIDNRDCWPLAVAFDIWLANYDRRSANLIFGPEPPTTRPAVARAGTCWLIDHGLTCLWYPGKIDPALEAVSSVDVEAVADPTALFTPKALDRFRNVINREIVEYRRAFTDLVAAEREAVLDHIRQVTDDQIDGAVRGVPPAYFSPRAADLTVAFLRARRDSIANVANQIWPI